MARPNRAIAAFALALLGAVANGEDPPKAPEGFAWKKIDSVKATFLVPEGWHFKEERKDETRAFFITQEDIDRKGQFETGLTVNVSHLKEERAQDRATAIIAALAQNPGHELQDAWESETGVLKGIGGRIRRTETGHSPLLMNVLAVGNSRTNALYLIIFESPEANWKAAWSKGEPMMRLFVLDDAY